MVSSFQIVAASIPPSLILGPFQAAPLGIRNFLWRSGLSGYLQSCLITDLFTEPQSPLWGTGRKVNGIWNVPWCGLSLAVSTWPSHRGGGHFP